MTRKELTEKAYNVFLKLYSENIYRYICKDYRQSLEYEELSGEQKFLNGFDIDTFKECFDEIILNYYENAIGTFDELED